jgi:hypothetical protein
MVTINQINFTKETLNFLCYFLRLIDKIIKTSDHNSFRYKIYETKYAFSDSFLGYGYSISKINSKKRAVPWFGINYDEDIFIEIFLNKDLNNFIEKIKYLYQKKMIIAILRK